MLGGTMNLKDGLIGIGILLTFAPGVFAGGATSGGGGTHTCLGADGSIVSSELYDFYEGRELREYQLVDPKGKSANELLNDAMEKLYASDPSYAIQVLQKLKYYVAHKKPIYGKHLAVITDANIVLVDEGCQYQQIAQWRDEYQTVFVDGDLEKFFSQSPLNIAGLALHEAIYAVEREKQATHSDYTRKLVAQLFSNQSVDHRTSATILWSQNPKASYQLQMKALHGSFTGQMVSSGYYLNSGVSGAKVLEAGDSAWRLPSQKLDDNGILWLNYFVYAGRNYARGIIDILRDNRSIYSIVVNSNSENGFDPESERSQNWIIAVPYQASKCRENVLRLKL